MFLFAVQRPDRSNQIQRRQEGRLQVGLAQTQDCKTYKGEVLWISGKDDENEMDDEDIETENHRNAKKVNIEGRPGTYSESVSIHER